MTKHIAIVGATSAIAEHCARLWAEQENATFSLIVRNRNKCLSVQKDLETRNPNISCEIHECIFTSTESIRQTVETIAEIPVDIALIAHGTLPDQSECESNLFLCEETLTLNGTSTALFAEAFAMQMSPLDHGHIAIIGSVAGDRGRKSNYVYGAAKRLVEGYAQGLQHRFAGTGVSVTLIKPGPTKTPMTSAMKNSGSFTDVSEVARHIVKAIAVYKNEAYVPGNWRLIMFIIRHLPRLVFNKLNI